MDIGSPECQAKKRRINCKYAPKFRAKESPDQIAVYATWFKFYFNNRFLMVLPNNVGYELRCGAHALLMKSTFIITFRCRHVVCIGSSGILSFCLRRLDLLSANFLL